MNIEFIIRIEDTNKLQGILALISDDGERIEHVCCVDGVSVEQVFCKILLEYKLKVHHGATKKTGA
jgi:hypothetical protein